jgi:hypothetical protein
MEELMHNFFKSKIHFRYQPLLVITIVIVLLLSTANMIMAAPFSVEPNKLGIFISYDAFTDGSIKSQDINSYGGLDFGVSIPLSFGGNCGFKTSINSSSSYSYYEFFANWKAFTNTLMDATFEHLNDDGNLLRFGLFRALSAEDDNVQTYFGPGLSFYTGDSTNSFSIFLQMKASYHVGEGMFMYGSLLHDFNINNSQAELGMEFTY